MDDFTAKGDAMRIRLAQNETVTVDPRRTAIEVTMLETRQRPSAVLALATGLMVVVGCDMASGPDIAERPMAVAQLPASPVKVCILQDKSGSAGHTRTEQFTEAHIEPLLSLIRESGGEIAIGVIQEESDRSLTRVRMERTGSAPTVLGKRPDTGNAIKLIQLQKEWDAKKVEWKAKQAAHEKALADHNAAMALRMSGFLRAIRPIIKRPANSPWTDIYGGLNRADLFLAEPDTIWHATPHKYLLIVSDGLHEGVDKPPVTVLRSDATLILANGAGSQGALEGLDPIRVESIDAAVEFIIASEGTR
jgi:hypothetical protein